FAACAPARRVALWTDPYGRRNAWRVGSAVASPRGSADRPARTPGGAVSDSDLMFRPATELAGMVRAGDVSARELVQLSLERIEELNPALNAFVEVDAEGALASA